ncbi:MAG TPA: alpha/beta hydrolase [Flavobacteriaceae bacterium]|nr:alpha/beta hydrolase [Flavobacteriaceae bacterium]
MKNITCLLICFASAIGFSQTHLPFHLTLKDSIVPDTYCFTEHTDYSALKIIPNEAEKLESLSITLALSDTVSKKFEDYKAFNQAALKFWLIENSAFENVGTLTFSIENLEGSLTYCISPSEENTIKTRGSQAPYVKLPIFFATDRNYVNTSDVYEQFGTKRSDIKYGVCQVSIPHDHKIGQIESPSLWRFEFSEDPEKHVVLHEIDVMEKANFFKKLSSEIKQTKKKNTFLFVHGYNTSFADAAKRTAQISYDLLFDGKSVFYSWPSKQALAEYTRDEANIEWAQTNIKNFLEDYITKSGAEEIYLVAHSMGNRGLTRAITDLLTEKPHLREKVKEIILAAPDIDADVFKRDIAPKMVKAVQKPITMYVSSDDLALKASKEVHGYARAGDSGDGLILIKGIETVDASGIDTSFLSHNYFADTSSIISDIFDLIRTGKRALQRKNLKQIQTKNNIYYKVIHN